MGTNIQLPPRNMAENSSIFSNMFSHQPRRTKELKYLIREHCIQLKTSRGFYKDLGQSILPKYLHSISCPSLFNEWSFRVRKKIHAQYWAGRGGGGCKQRLEKMLCRRRLCHFSQEGVDFSPASFFSSSLPIKLRVHIQ
jgi:hypothetical protein